MEKTLKGRRAREIALDTLVQELKRELLPMLSLPKRYLTDEEASHYLGLSVHTLRQWRSKNIGPDYLRVGARIVYDVKALDTWMGQFRVKQ
jgi:hypothetical protein